MTYQILNTLDKIIFYLLYMKKIKKLIILLVIILIFYLVFFYKNEKFSKYEKISIKKKYIFIGGLHRSGTSILNEIIGSSDKVAKHKNTGKPEDEGQHIQTVFDNGIAHGGVGRFCFDDNYHYTENNKLITSDNKIKLLLEWNKYWDISKSIFLEKSPVNLIHTRFLQKMFDNTYFIVIMRHPLAVSKASLKWNNQSLNKYFDHWLRGYDIFLNDSKYLRRYILIKYEDLCNDPQKEVKKIENLIGEKLNIKDSELNRLYNSNSKYFVRLDSKLIDKYEKKFNKFGYSLKNV
tara:strand:- start:614 stop:1489 length:876 start_codon:yes stop_codon:yes gene_type:complete